MSRRFRELEDALIFKDKDLTPIIREDFKTPTGVGYFRAGIFFSLAPFVGVVVSFALLHEWIGWVMLPAIILTIAGVWLIPNNMSTFTCTANKCIRIGTLIMTSITPTNMMAWLMNRIYMNTGTMKNITVILIGLTHITGMSINCLP